MNRVCGRVLAGLALVAGGGIIGPACSHDDTTLFIRSVLFAAPVAAGQSCVFTSDPTQAFMSSGELDVDFSHEYKATFLVGNQMVPEVNPSTPSTETSFINVLGSVVRITDATGVQLNTFTRLAGATVPPSSGTTPGYAPILDVTILDQATVENPSFFDPIETMRQVKRVVTYTRFFGKTLGGISVESNEFEYPIDVCRGCLIDFSQSDQSTAGTPQPNCLGNGNGTSTTTTTVPCNPGEDVAVSCSQCLALPDCNGNVAIVVTPTDAGITDAAGGG